MAHSWVSGEITWKTEETEEFSGTVGSYQYLLFSHFLFFLEIETKIKIGDLPICRLFSE